MAEFPDAPHVTGDETRRCLGPEDIAIIEGELPAPRSRYEEEEPGVLSIRGRVSEDGG